MKSKIKKEGVITKIYFPPINYGDVTFTICCAGYPQLKALDKYNWQVVLNIALKKYEAGRDISSSAFFEGTTTDAVIYSQNVISSFNVYSSFERWAYDWYKLQWCVDRGVLPNDVDEEVGINGGQCYVCKDEFLNNEFQEAHIFNYFFKTYLLIQLLAWIWDVFEDSEVIFEDDIKMSPAEITTYTGITNATDGKQKLIDYKMVLCRHSQLAENKVDKLIENSMDFLCSSVNKDKFVEEFVYRLSFRGYDNEIQF